MHWIGSRERLLGMCVCMYDYMLLGLAAALFGRSITGGLCTSVMECFHTPALSLLLQCGCPVATLSDCLRQLCTLA